MKKKAYIFAIIIGTCYLCVFIYFVFIGARQTVYEKWPTIELAYTDIDGREESVPMNRFCGCRWDFYGEQKLAEPNLTGDRVQTICVEEGTAVAFRVVYQTQPEEIIVKEFQNERVTEDAAGKIIAKNLQSLTCNPGYTYTIELLYDAESITYGLRCE